MLPALFIFAQDEEELSRARNKTLAPWPGLQVLATAPERYFGSAKRWINDRVGFGISAAGLIRWVKLYVFRDDPLPNLTLGGDYLFLNAWNADPKIRFILFREACAPPNRSRTTGFKYRIDSLDQYFQHYNADFRLIIIPSMPVIYARSLPLTVPDNLRRSCLNALQGVSAVAQLADAAPERIVYPLREFVARSKDSAFYPASSFHCVGESSWLAAEKYFRRFGVPFPNNSTLETFSMPSELSRFLGFKLRIEANAVKHKAERPLRQARSDSAKLKEILKRGGAREFAYLENPDAKSDQVALVLSNSFGASVKNDLARGYRRLFQVNVAQLVGDGKRSDELLRSLMETLKPAHVILVTHDGGTASLLRRVAAATTKSNSPAGKQ